MTPLDRFSARYEVNDDGCWLWTGPLEKTGYARMWHKGRNEFAHRFAYTQFVGQIPDAMQLDHLCRVRHCVNPAHVEPVTPRENTLRGTGPSAVNAQRTHCINGHEFTPENTYDQQGRGRGCVLCRREVVRRYRLRRKAA